MRVKEDLIAEYAAYVTTNVTPREGDVMSVDYAKAVIVFAERWANLMEEAILTSDGPPPRMVIEQVAKTLERDADEGIGITAFQYGCVVSALARFWEFGEPLREWHNLSIQIGDEGEKANASGGVLNPAILDVG